MGVDISHGSEEKSVFKISKLWRQVVWEWCYKWYLWWNFYEDKEWLGSLHQNKSITSSVNTTKLV